MLEDKLLKEKTPDVGEDEAASRQRLVDAMQVAMGGRFLGNEEATTGFAKAFIACMEVWERERDERQRWRP
jgi:hypothetical protein